jgi:hypothetical protein
MNARAVLSLNVAHCLLLSGTPAQNKLDDLQVALALMQHSSKRLDFKESEAIYRRLSKASKLDNAISKLMKPKDVVHFHNITPVRSCVPFNLPSDISCHRLSCSKSKSLAGMS